MGKFELKNGARLAAAAGLGLTLALGAAPVVALADGTGQEATANQPILSENGVLTIDSEEQLAYAIANASDEAYEGSPRGSFPRAPIIGQGTFPSL